MSGMRYIENEGALFRGYARGWPEEVYSFRQRKWLPYEGPVPKGVEWGEFISAEEAEAMIASEHERDLHRFMTAASHVVATEL